MPPASQGNLYLNGVLVTNLSQVANLTPTQAGQLSFFAASGFNGFANFTYTVIDNSGNVGNVANYVIPVGTGSVLPLRIISFTAVANANTASTNWVIAEAINVASFEILSSTNGSTFKAIGTVTFTNGVAKYSFTDANPSKDINYYRLKIIDTDGKIAYSNIVSVKFGKATNEIIVYPNPVADVLYVNFDASNNGKQALIRLLDFTGKVLLLKSEKISSTITTINMAQLPASTYVLQIIIANEIVNNFTVIRK